MARPRFVRRIDGAPARDPVESETYVRPVAVVEAGIRPANAKSKPTGTAAVPVGAFLVPVGTVFGTKQCREAKPRGVAWINRDGERTVDPLESRPGVSEHVPTTSRGEITSSTHLCQALWHWECPAGTPPVSLASEAG